MRSGSAFSESFEEEKNPHESLDEDQPLFCRLPVDDLTFRANGETLYDNTYRIPAKLFHDSFVIMRHPKFFVGQSIQTYTALVEI